MTTVASTPIPSPFVPTASDLSGKPLTISLLIPCYNEDRSIEASIKSCLAQTRPFDQLIFVNDCSKDRTGEILAKYADRITVVTTLRNTGNKSSAQEYGLGFVTGEILVTTDGDTLLDPSFVAEIEKSFSDPRVAAVAGYVRSLPHNWLTLCRAFEYAMGQGIHKLAQHYMNYIFVMPGAAAAFRTSLFREHCTFDHDTITEDLDFTYKMHRKKLKIIHNPRIITYTQDPTTLHDYANQVRRWFGGGWQNLLKHWRMVPEHPVRALELSLIYSEGIVFSVLLFLIPLINLWVWLWLIVGYFFVATVFCAWAAWFEKRPALLLVPIPYVILVYINAYIYIEQFMREIIFRRKNLVWFKPERVAMSTTDVVDVVEAAVQAAEVAAEAPMHVVIP
jgi:cellulose synthase/poly-beta-1,6-N-acetylglucosamine synthase-like glycosyltransferase